MNKKQIEQYKHLASMKEKAAFLLNVGVSAKPMLREWRSVNVACIGDISLPVEGETKEEAIKAGIDWLAAKRDETTNEIT